MPIVEVQIVGEKITKENLAHSLANAAGEILSSRPGGTWVKLSYLPEDQYAENESALAKISPVFVSLLLGKPPANKKEIAFRISSAFAGILDKPSENIHVLFEPEAAGRIAFGGKLRQ